MGSMLKLMCGALVVTLILFVEILAGAVNNDWIILVVLIPAFLTPLPLLMLKCCGGNDDPFGTVSKGTHWAQFMSGFFFTGVIALPCMLFSTNLIGVPSLILSLSGIVMAIIVGGVIACLAARESSDPLSFQAW